ncbi:hypothetical protein OROGR_017709 [Orobanche gracilis]
MKPSSNLPSISFFLLIIIFSTSARHLQGDTGPLTKPKEIIEMQLNDFYGLMGLEECGGDNDGESCEKRRMVAEAHLDYIYTQHQHH